MALSARSITARTSGRLATSASASIAGRTRSRASARACPTRRPTSARVSGSSVSLSSPMVTSSHCRRPGARARSSRLRLIAGLRRGAVDLRLHAQVVKGPGGDRYRGRSGVTATSDGPVVIAALPRSEGTDNQPDGKQRRSDMHVVSLSYLPQIKQAARNSGRTLILTRPSQNEAYPGAAIPGPLCASRGCFSRNLEASGQCPQARGAARWPGCPPPRPDMRSAAVLVAGRPPRRGEGGEYDGRTEIVACGVIERSAARDQVQGRVAGRAVNVFRGEF